MKWRHLALAAVLVSVCSCFLKQDPPTPIKSQVSGGPVEGVIMMEDLQTSQGAAAEIHGGFWLKTAARDLAKGFEETDLRSLRITPPSPRAKGTQCQVAHSAKGGSGAKETKYVSAGVMSFGAALQGGVLAMDQDASGQYSRRLDPGLPAGVYQVKADGSSEIPSFGVSLSLPEALQNVTFLSSTDRDASYEDSAVMVHKNQPLNIGWKAPALMNQNSLMIADVFSETANELWRVRCLTREAELTGGGGILQWAVPTEYLNQLPTSNAGQVYLFRAHLFESKGDNLDVQTQGLRVFFGDAQID